MELAQVKQRVKQWEKAFVAKHSRGPTKDDIKQDKSDIASQYALYRQLSKAAKSSSLVKSNGGPTSATTSASSNLSSTYGTTIPPANPSTPTPTRRRSSGIVPVAPAAPVFAVPDAEAGPSRPKRPAADLEPVTPQKGGSTPKRARGSMLKPGYCGPVHDPNPNPFSVTPKKAGPNDTHPAPGVFVSPLRAPPADSPFIHASSPRRLREVLEANSLRKSRARADVPVDITPRTRARKRLAGDPVDDTPVKVRKRRGERTGLLSDPSSSQNGFSEEPFGDAAPFNYSDGEADEDELGETPVKPGMSSFALFEDGASRTKAAPGLNGATNGKAKAKATAADLFPVLNPSKRPATGAAPAAPVAKKGQADTGAKARRAAVLASMEAEKVEKTKPRGMLGAEGQVDEDQKDYNPFGPAGDDVPDVSAHSEGTQDTPPARSPSPLPATPSRTRHTPRKAHMLALSDGEDGFDPEAHKRTVRIVGTKRKAIKVADDVLASDDEDMVDGDVGEEADAEDETSEEEEDEDDQVDGEVTAANAESHRLLALLSLRSPIGRTGERLADLRVRALLDPTSAAAAALRAARRGQDVFVSGEGVDGDEDEELRDIEEGWKEGGEGIDDDWESDPEGWKAAPFEDDDW